MQNPNELNINDLSLEGFHSARDFTDLEDLQDFRNHKVKDEIGCNLTAKDNVELEKPSIIIEESEKEVNERISKSRRIWHSQSLLQRSSKNLSLHQYDDAKLTLANSNELAEVVSSSINGIVTTTTSAISSSNLSTKRSEGSQINICGATDNNGYTCEVQPNSSSVSFEKVEQEERNSSYQVAQTYGEIVIKIEERSFSIDAHSEADLTARINQDNSSNAIFYLDSCKRLNSPSAPPPSPLSNSTFDLGKLQHCASTSSMNNMLSQLRVTTTSGCNRGGSLSDSTHQNLSRSSNYQFVTRQMEEQLRSWKRANKIITHIHENPFNMHIDCMEQLDSTKTSVGGSSDGQQFGSTTITRERTTIFEDRINSSVATDEKQQEQLQNYASHLSDLYKSNQALMDKNNDFRTLLYNIICCLLIQDEQVLSTPSVTKMIEVIRTHLESTSKFYSSAIASISTGHSQLPGASTIEMEHSKQVSNVQLGSLGSLSCVSSTSSNCTTTLTSNNSTTTTATTTGSNVQSTTTCNMLNVASIADRKSNPSLLYPNAYNDCRRDVPADFRRISSVSYNDEQLINDLCAKTPEECNNSNDKRVSGQDSPWKYEELSSECKHLNCTRTSQSSLEINSNVDMMNDSGIGTVCNSQETDDMLSLVNHPHHHRRSSSSTQSVKKRFSDVSRAVDFKPQQQPSYMSTDEYLSQMGPDETSYRTSLYDGDESPASQRRDLSEHRSVNVASRRAELEWTLNKLINFELKYTWLTSKDTLRRAIRKVGVPNEIRGKVWLILIEQMIGTKYNAAELLEEAGKTIDNGEQFSNDEEIVSILKQIDLDVNRTMPGHKLFDDGAEGGIKLRRILVAYSIHINRAIAYCQGFNFIVALLLSVFEGDEEKALRGFVCIVDHIFPSKFYFDHYLTGARADQFLLADFICDQLIKNPTTAERKMVEGVTSSITLNWFISLFHGAVPTLTRLTILDHFMLEGVKALFRFTMAILYLAFQVTPPSSCEVFTTIRNTARDMYDIKLLLSIVGQIKLPKDSYFAIRRSFYMVQSSFNSDQFYMQSLSNDASRQLVANKPLSVQQLPDVKPPAISLITAASLVAHQSFGITSDHQQSFNMNNNCKGLGGAFGPRVCTSSDRSKVCVQNIGKLGRSHLRIMDANIRSNERSLMSPLRNCLVIGITNDGKNIIVARQSSRRNFKTFREQELTFHVHELSTEIFDGFFLENLSMALILTHLGEIFKIDVTKCFADSQVGSTETLMLKDSQTFEENEKVKLRLASLDPLTQLLWVYVECEDTTQPNLVAQKNEIREKIQPPVSKTKERSNNPFLDGTEDSLIQNTDNQTRFRYQRKIIIVEIKTFDVFSAFTLHPSFGDIINMRTSLFAFCQLSNPMSNQFSLRVVQIGPTGRYEHLLSFSDVVDYMVDAPDSYLGVNQKDLNSTESSSTNQRYSTIKKLLIRSISTNYNDTKQTTQLSSEGYKISNQETGSLAKYYRSLIKSHSTAVENPVMSSKRELAGSTTEILAKGRSLFGSGLTVNSDQNHESLSKSLLKNNWRTIMTARTSDIDEAMETNYIPVNMVFIFRNGKIALFEFTESYAIHTRESQLDRYDYSKVIEVAKSGEDFIITILTIYDKLIKVVI